MALRLVVDNVNKVQADLRGVGEAGEASFKRLDRTVAESDKKLDGLALRAKAARVGVVALGAAAAAAAGAAALGAMVNSALQTADALAKAADSANIGVERFQSLKFAAGQAGVEAGVFEDGMRRLNRRLGLFVADGGGPAAKAFERLGLANKVAIGELQNSEQVFDAAVRALGRISDSAERTALASQLFGEDAGPRLALLLNQGAEGIGKLEQRARELGLVLEEELIRKSEETGDQIAELTQQIEVNLTRALLGLQQPIRDAVALLGDFGVAAGKLYGEFQENAGALGQLFALPAGQLAELAKLRAELAYLEGSVALTRSRGSQEAIEQLERDILSVKAQMLAIYQGSPGAPAPAAPGGRPSGGTPVTLSQGINPLAGADYGSHLRLVGAAERSKQALEQAKAAQEAQKRFDDYLKGLERERDLAGLTTEERQRQQALLEAQARLGRELTEAEARRVGEIVKASQARVAEQRKIEETQRQLERLSQSVAGSLRDSLVSALDGVETRSVSLFERMRQLAANLLGDSLENQVLQPAVNSFFNSFLGSAGGAAGGAAGGGGILGNNLFTSGVQKGLESYFGGSGGSAGGSFLTGLFGTAGGSGAAVTAAHSAGVAAVPGGVAQLGTAGALSSGGSAASGLSGALGAVPVWGWIALAASIAKGFVQGSDNKLAQTADILLLPSLEQWQANPGRSLVNAVDPILSAGLNLAGISIGGKPSVGPNAGATIGFQGGQFGIAAINSDNGGNQNAIGPEAERAAGLLNLLLQQSGASVSKFAAGNERGGGNGLAWFADRGITIGADAVIKSILANSTFEGGDQALIERARNDGIEAALQKAAADEQAAEATERATAALEGLEQRLATGGDSLRSFFDRLIDPLAGFAADVAFGGLSAAAPGDRLAAARSSYGSTLEAARGGDLGALEDLPGLGRSVLDIGRDVFASGPQFTALSREIASGIASVQADLEGQRSSSLAEFSVPLVQTLQMQTRTLKAALEALQDEMRQTKDAIRQLREAA